MSRYYGASESINLCKGVEKIRQFFRSKISLSLTAVCARYYQSLQYYSFFLHKYVLLMPITLKEKTTCEMDYKTIGATVQEDSENLLTCYKTPL